MLNQLWLNQALPEFVQRIVAGESPLVVVVVVDVGFFRRTNESRNKENLEARQVEQHT